MRVSFCHLDLGLGGAERWLVDAAMEAKRHGHDVKVYTGRRDPKHCFVETRDGTVDVHVTGGWMPRHVGGKMHACCAYLKCAVVAWTIAWDQWKGRRKHDVIVVDQVAFVVPLLRMWTNARVLYYCHFPDLLLSKPKNAIHRAYRAPIDWIEETSTAAAHKILVNSQYTQDVFRTTFRTLAHVETHVVHPAVDVPKALTSPQDARKQLQEDGNRDVAAFCARPKHLFLSINRFESKKGLELALQALEWMHRNTSVDAEDLPCLVVAGGYDPRIHADVQYNKTLLNMQKEARSKAHVLFLYNVTDTTKHALLSCCTAVLYTPTFEHFGIVPLEAMARAKPVIACNSGGPMETILHQKTGFLVEPCPSAFAQAMQALTSDPSRAAHMGCLAREHVQQRFSRAAFGDRINQEIVDLAKEAVR
mmetsp:Transcript_3905/g.24707  ORF Transcript_3905/g.24707 Transcript_3905/m.24707 type:complete len:419 (-) Transcript_3905:985-2241(-)